MQSILAQQINALRAKILIVPGKGNSESGHWQSLLEARLPGARRVQQANWQQPSLMPWAERIAMAAREHDGPVLVVAHSFGCLAAVQALTALGSPIAATLLVAPADPDRFGIDPTWLQSALPGVHRMVISSNDPWLSPARAHALARAWKIPALSLGYAGHINVAAGFGAWLRGDVLLAKLLARLIDQSAAGVSLLPADPQSVNTPLPSQFARQGIAL